MMLFVALVLVINATASVLVHHHLDIRVAHLISYAACFDMTVTIPALYYLLVVRRGTQTLRAFCWYCCYAWCVPLSWFPRWFTVPSSWVSPSWVPSS
ncbi:MAG: hypothetical protein ACRYFU_19110 [Janthinobacterium lividum]